MACGLSASSDFYLLLRIAIIPFLCLDTPVLAPNEKQDNQSIDGDSEASQQNKSVVYTHAFNPWWQGKYHDSGHNVAKERNSNKAIAEDLGHGISRHRGV